MGHERGAGANFPTRRHRAPARPCVWPAQSEPPPCPEATSSAPLAPDRADPHRPRPATASPGPPGRARACAPRTRSPPPAAPRVPSAARAGLAVGWTACRRRARPASLAPRCQSSRGR
eukprot:7175637-Prymnesium_polylepis.2